MSSKKRTGRRLEFKVQTAKDEAHDYRKAQSGHPDYRSSGRQERQRANGAPVEKLEALVSAELARRLRFFCVDRRRTMTSVILEGIEHVLTDEPTPGKK